MNMTQSSMHHSRSGGVSLESRDLSRHVSSVSTRQRGRLVGGRHLKCVSSLTASHLSSMVSQRQSHRALQRHVRIIVCSDSYLMLRNKPWQILAMSSCVVCRVSRYLASGHFSYREPNSRCGRGVRMTSSPPLFVKTYHQTRLTFHRPVECIFSKDARMPLYLCSYWEPCMALSQVWPNQSMRVARCVPRRADCN